MSEQEGKTKSAIVIGCGLSGAVIARELAENGFKVQVLERRNHIGGNMYDYVDEHGILVHKYGPHTFHTKKRELFDYMNRYAEWEPYNLTCGAKINGICTPTPFNFQTIDDFYPPEKARLLKEHIKKAFPGQETATVVEALQCEDELVREYAQFLFDNDYSLYTAKQWGVPASTIDPSVLKRVPLRFSYNIGYFDDEIQVMPKTSYTDFFKNLLNHPSIKVELNMDAMDHLSIREKEVMWDGDNTNMIVIYTGPLDALFDYCYGQLPYRSLRFEWKYENIDSKQEMPVVAYPQVKDFIRIIEFKKLPVQDVKGTTYEIEYSLPFIRGKQQEPYYPVLTVESQEIYQKYSEMANQVNGLYVCGRLGDFRYYNMDQALEKAIATAKEILSF